MEEKNYLEARKALSGDDKFGSQIMEVATVLNSKTSALLTHVSIMIAVSTGMFVYLSTVQSSYDFIKIILLIEIIAYLITSLFCLNAISISESCISPQERERLIDKRIQEIGMRRKFYRIALSFTVFLTITLILVLLVETVALDHLLRTN